MDCTSSLLPVVNGVVLVGESSRRMGRPKQLLVHNGMTFSERAVAAMKNHVDQVVLSGSGQLPEAIEDLLRLADPPGVAGPLAGVLAAMRWAPGAAWVVAACDMPRISEAAVRWLLDQRRPGTWSILPRSREGRVETLLAVYEPQVRSLLEAQAAGGRWGLKHLAEDDRVVCPTPPVELADCWINVNTPEDVESEVGSGL